MEQIPIIIDGEACGQLRLRREGAYMVCSGSLRGGDAMQRLWLYGSGAPVYLGVAVPDGQGGSTVRKKFSLADNAHLPRPLTHCGTEQQTVEKAAPQPASEADVLWVRQPDGTLCTAIGRRRYIAFPADCVRLPRGGGFLLRQIEGRDYVIFPC